MFLKCMLVWHQDAFVIFGKRWPFCQHFNCTVTSMHDCIVCKFSKEKCGINVVNEVKDFWYRIDLLSISTR